MIRNHEILAIEKLQILANADTEYLNEIDRVLKVIYLTAKKNIHHLDINIKSSEVYNVMLQLHKLDYEVKRVYKTNTSTLLNIKWGA